MKRWHVVGLLIALAVAGCASRSPDSGWVTLIDGEKGLENFNRLGGANWRAEGGAIVADKSTTKEASHLVTKESYKDFEIYAEFYAESNTNSGIFIRASNPKQVGANNAYEVNIWDTRPDPTYATGAIVDFAAVPVPIVYKAGGRWNTLEIYAKGNVMTVKFNGQVTAYLENDKFKEGPFTLQMGGGPIKWRLVQVRRL
jgi:hypothetical protein